MVRLAGSSDTAHELVPMLGLGAHVGELLLAQQRYLSESLVAETSKGMICSRTGHGAEVVGAPRARQRPPLNSIAHANLIKVDERARSLGIPGRRSRAGAQDGDPRAWLSTPSSRRRPTKRSAAGVDPLSLSVPMLGLAGEVGTLLVAEKKRYRRDSKVDDWPSFVSIELGDLLWYTATVARHAGLGLDGGSRHVTWSGRLGPRR